MNLSTQSWIDLKINHTSVYWHMVINKEISDSEFRKVEEFFHVKNNFVIQHWVDLKKNSPIIYQKAKSLLSRDLIVEINNAYGEQCEYKNRQLEDWIGLRNELPDVYWSFVLNHVEIAYEVELEFDDE